MTTEIINIEWYEVKDTWLRGIKDPTVVKDPNIQSKLRTWGTRPEDRSDGWEGASTGQIKQWLRDGYTPPESVDPDAYTPQNERRKIRFGEEGDVLHIDLALNGDPQPFQSWERREAKPGISIVVDYALNCGTPAKVVTEYATWLAGLVNGLETSGYDVEMDVQIAARGVFNGSRAVQQIRIRVAREGEQTDFTEWSALFSPGGFRILGFTAMGMAADKQGKTTAYGLGTPSGAKFGVEFDEATRTLHVHAPAGAQNFPAEQMTEQVRECGLIH